MSNTSKPLQAGKVESNESPDYMNERVIQRNRLDPRAYFLPKETLSLSGRWKFHFTTSPKAPEPKSDHTAAWSSIDVPGHWQLQGWGHPHYTNFDLPFPCDPPYVPAENPTGTYETSFEIPDGWLDIDGGLDYRLRFEGVDSAFHLWVNGKEIGYSQGSRNPAEFDVTKVLKDGAGGSNTVRVKVYQWSDGSYMEDQDMWWLSGIFRDVYLIGFHKRGHIEDIRIRTNLDQHHHINKPAYLEIDLLYHVQSTSWVHLALVDANGSRASGTSSTKLKPGGGLFSHSIHVVDPRLWNAEHPNLYYLYITLDNDGKQLQQEIQQVGFRKVEIKDGLLQVNNVPISLRGVNRHDHHPRFGRAVPLEFIERDLILMKQHNVNAVRTSHYPNDPRLILLANEIGLYVMDEADNETHGTNGILSDRPTWTNAYVERMRQLVYRDKNNPSVIMWSLGNESFYGKNHQAMYDWVKAYDSTRPVHYEADHEFRASDVCSYMYVNPAQLEQLATQDGDDYKKPIILQEYGHAMGNGPGAMKEYMETFRKCRRLQGGFIWEWNNHGLVKPLNDSTREYFYAYGGDFGDEPNDKNFVMDGLVNSEHNPSPGLIDLRAAYAPILVTRKGKKIRARNLFDFHHLEDIDCVWSVKHFEADGFTRTLKYGIEKLKHPPQHDEEFDVFDCDSHQLNCKISEHETWLILSFQQRAAQRWCNSGHEITHAEFRLDDSSTANLFAQHLKGFQNPQVQETAGTLQVSTSTSTLTISRIDGQIIHWSYKGIDMIRENSLNLTFWRAPTDNDEHGQGGDWYGHRLNDLFNSVRSFTYGFTKAGVLEVKITSDVAPAVQTWGFEVSLTFTYHSSGALVFHTKISPRGPAPGTLPRVGLEMVLPGDRTRAEWFGLGPDQSYRDMKNAAKVGVWKKTVDELNFMYDMPQESGNRTETRWVKVTNERGIGFKAVLERDSEKTSRPPSAESTTDEPGSLQNWSLVDKSLDQSKSSRGFDFNLSRYTARDLEQAQHPHELTGCGGVVFRIDDEHHGLGTAACGPDALDSYQLKTRTFDFSVCLEPLGP
ncbi:uncharacterized protein KY384_008438 [Bacidia gigantensis]|uniref:uncharacterized protein n=1 Tax=Bacidia gigantensis TaxID=2732470 RepID=UPI001D055802|nr:uncharacterized protein KY384_008438 [Bacidia gigantensis]KAG8527009.1 hypothetical protein KY384_008438 [Bacidia gigantensis]